MIIGRHDIRLICRDLRNGLPSWLSSVKCSSSTKDSCCSVLCRVDTQVLILIFQQYKLMQTLRVPTTTRSIFQTWSNDGKYLLVGFERKLVFYEKTDSKCVFSITHPFNTGKHHDIRDLLLAVNPSGTYFLCVSHLDGVHITPELQIESDMKIQWIHVLRSYPISSMTISTSYLAIAAIDGHIGIWKRQDFSSISSSPDAIWSTAIDQARTTSIAISPCEQYIAFAVQNGTIFVFEQSAATLYWQDSIRHKSIKTMQLSACFVEWSACSSFLLTSGCSDDSLIEILHVKTDIIIQRMIMSSSNDKTAFITGLCCYPSKEIVCHLSTGQVISFAF